MLDEKTYFQRTRKVISKWVPPPFVSTDLAKAEKKEKSKEMKSKNENFLYG